MAESVHLSPYSAAKLDIRLANSLEWLYTNSNTNASQGFGYLADTTLNTIEITLPASPVAGNIIGISDAADNASTNDITINRNGNKINGAASNISVSSSPTRNYILIYVNSTVGWKTLIGGIIDHGRLTGLSDDDHTQYHNNTRGDARYLYKANTSVFTPTGNYHPATKKYVDDTVSALINSIFAYSFNSPSDADLDALHFQLEISDEKDFSNPLVNVSTMISQDNWYLFTGTVFENFPSTGLEPGYYGLKVSYYIPASTLARGIQYFVRYRATDDEGVSWSDYLGDIVVW